MYDGVLGNWELACRRKELPNLCGSWRQKLGNINVDKWAIDRWLTMWDAIHQEKALGSIAYYSTIEFYIVTKATIVYKASIYKFVL